MPSSNNSSQRSESKRQSHVQPRTPLLDLRQPGRLRTAHVLALLSISHATLYNRLRDGSFPAPDGKDGRQFFWNTSTVLKVLEAANAE